MRSNWNRDLNRGPHGFGYGYGRRMHHRPAGGGLFLLPVILFGGLIGLRVILILASVAWIVAGSVFTGLAAAFRGVMSALGAVFSTAFTGISAPLSVAAGAAIGLILYRSIRSRKAEREAQEEAEAEPVLSEYADDPEANGCTEAESFRSGTA